jgi:hypothetical protein
VHPFNPNFEDTLATLWTCSEALELPEIVHQGVIRVLENPGKLFCLVGHAETAVGADAPKAGLYASDLFVKLIVALRALDWEVVVILLEQATSPPIPSSTATPLEEPLSGLDVPSEAEDWQEWGVYAAPEASGELSSASSSRQSLDQIRRVSRSRETGAESKSSFIL